MKCWRKSISGTHDLGGLPLCSACYWEVQGVMAFLEAFDWAIQPPLISAENPAIVALRARAS